ncbi:hypothetical protein CNYM01_08125 [Colletotrichum nymphaeae SA-01]|uniref:Clr5 domain-containing protein n=1 Tax=Colletotrichum nymphaeae SA-01 TaxID=1460502 RepID=A0A135UXR2_9PEZI|nr:hypothetical protein CNYM01_08125 [Colletotrichum nymphaeae SA-01]
MASSRKRHSDEEWLQHRAAIQRMFLRESASSVEIMRVLEDNGFPVTKSQLEYKLKVWGFRRKIPKNEAKIFWQFVDDRLAKREQQGKLSQVIRDGKVIEPAKVRKGRGRYQRTTLEKFQAGSATPEAPPGFNITVCTPATSNMKFIWPRSLPWLEFQTVFPELPRDHGTYMRTGLGSELPKIPVDLDILKRLHVPTSSNGSSVALLTAQLASMMPEGQEGENARLAQALLQAPTQSTITEHYKFILYQFSNNMEMFGTSSDLYCWDKTLNMLEDSGIMSLKFLVGKTGGPTINSFAEKLFQRALLMMFEIRLGDSTDSLYDSLGSDLTASERDLIYEDRLESLRARTEGVVFLLLSLGQNPDVRIYHPDLQIHTPLGLAISMNEPHLALQLLDAGADPHSSYTGFYEVLDDQEIFDPEFDREGKMAAVFQRLADSGLSLDEDGQYESALMLAIRRGSLTAADILIQSGANVLRSCYDVEYLCENPTSVLGCAADVWPEARAMELIKLLTDHAISKDPCLLPAGCFELDVVMNASFNGHVSILEYLHQAGYNIAVAEIKGLTALHVAASAGHCRACKWLLDHGSSVHGLSLSNEVPSPIIFAALGGNEDVVRLLHEAGADLNTSLSFEANENSYTNRCWIPYTSLCRWRETQIVRELGDNSINPAGAAILGYPWNNKVYAYLAEHGARLPGWAAYYGAYASSDIGLVKVALAEYSQVNINWLDQNKEKLLQTLLSLPSRDEDLRCQPRMQDQVVDLCFEVLSAGPVMVGGEAQLAMFLNSWGLVEAILQRDSTGGVQDNNGLSLLEAAFLSKSDTITQYVFERIPEAYDGFALCAAVLLVSERKCTKYLQRLLQNRQNLDCPSLLEGTAIGLAILNGEMQALKMLCGQIGTPLAAISPPSGTIQDALLQWTIRERQTPFWHDKHPEFTKPLLFIVESLRFKATLKKLGYRSWEHLIQVALNLDSEEILDIRLFSSDSDILPEQQKDKSMLFLVRSNGKLKPVEIGDFCKKTYMILERGRTPLQQAVEDGNLTKIDLLLSAGANINAPAADQAGATALQLAAITGRIGIAKMLIDMGADVDAPRASTSGRTALEGAAEHGRIDMIQLLLSEGAETGGNGRLQYMRAIKLAEHQGHLIAANMLREYRDWTVDDDDLWSELKDYPEGWEELDENGFFDYD